MGLSGPLPRFRYVRHDLVVALPSGGQDTPDGCCGAADATPAVDVHTTKLEMFFNHFDEALILVVRNDVEIGDGELDSSEIELSGGGDGFECDGVGGQVVCRASQVDEGSNSGVD